MAVIKVKLKERSYPIITGTDMSKQLVEQIKKNLNSNRLFIFYDSNFYALHGRKISKSLKRFKPEELIIPSGEKIKSEKELAKIQSYLLSNKISRSDFILAVGGGVTSDLIGYTAATTLRGINWGVISTTLLGMVDASIGGKTGINHKEGKNLIGAFWQPKFVIADLFYLNTLERRELFCGLGEVIKYAGLIGNPILKRLSKFVESEKLYNLSELLHLVNYSAKYKAGIVSADEREGKLRMLLNLGHTVGHAIEKSLGYKKLLHGEAVILGLYAAVLIGQKLNKSKSGLDDYKELIETMIDRLPRYIIDKALVKQAVGSDKKRINKKLNFILLEKPGKPIITESVKTADINNAIDLTLKRYGSRSSNA